MELALGGARYGFISTDGATRDDGDLTCVPHSATPARVRTQRPRNRKRYRAVQTFYGRVRNALRIRLTLVRRSRGRCEAWDGKRLRRASCSTKRSFRPDRVKPPRFPGAGTSTWKHRMPDADTLPPGGYRLDVRVRALDRSLESRSTRFTIRRR